MSAILVTISRIIVSYPLDLSVFHGPDFCGHMPLMWLISKTLNLGWNYLWYTGYPMIKFVSPASLLMGSFFNAFLSPQTAFKLVIDISFVLAPLAFLVFINNFDLTNRQKIVGLLTFSFLPSGVYYFWEGSFPTVLNVVLTLLLWHSIIRLCRDRSMKNLAFSGLFFSFAILTHQLTAVFGAAIITVWLIARYRKIMVTPFIIGALIASFWLVPFMLEYTGDSIVKQSAGIDTLVNSIITRMGTVPFVLMCLIGGSFFVYAALNYRNDKDFVSFSLVLLFMVIVLFLSSYNRIMYIVAVPLAMIAAKLYSKNRAVDMSIWALVVVSILVFFTFQGFFYMSGFISPDAPNLDMSKGRVIYYPENNFEHMLKWQEADSGNRPQFLNQKELSDTKRPYYLKLRDPLGQSQEETARLMQDGFFNYAVINIDPNESRYVVPFSDYINKSAMMSYFSSTDLFREVYNDGVWDVFELSNPPSYISTGSEPVNYSLNKSRNMIEASFACRPGELTVKESYDDYWKAEINGIPAGIGINGEGFMKINVTESGTCNLKMTFEEKPEYKILYIISFLAVASLLILVIKSNWRN